MEAEIKSYPTQMIDRRLLSGRTFEIRFSRPPGFTFKAGQRIRIHHQSVARDYTPVSAPADPDIRFCIRTVATGLFTPLLSRAESGSRFDLSGPDGYFTFKPSGRPAVFVATGTGIAPFCSMARAGVRGFTVLHGVDTPDDLYYQSELESAADLYVPCISKEYPSTTKYFRGRVTEYLQQHPLSVPGDFYLCGRREMIRDVTWLVDEKYAGCRIYTETFY